MDAKTFAAELEKIADETNEKIVALVHRAQEEDGLTIDTVKPVSFVDEYNWQDQADRIMQAGAWIYDRMKGINRLHKSSMGKKIRKVLGYTYP